MNYWKRLRVRLAGLLRAVRQVGRAERILQDSFEAICKPCSARASQDLRIGSKLSL